MTKHLLLLGMTAWLFMSCQLMKKGVSESSQASAYENLQLLAETAKNMTVEGASDDFHYVIKTTQYDPYVYTGKLTKDIDTEYITFSFEYKSGQELEFIQIFFAAPEMEQRSVKTGKVPASSEWQEWSFVARKPRADFSWGAAGDYLRLDFGNDAGYQLELRNIHFREMREKERQVEAMKIAHEQYEQGLTDGIRRYLDTLYPAFITEVEAGADAITVKGNYAGNGAYFLCEIPPYLDVTGNDAFTCKYPLHSSPFTESFDRYTERQGFHYDRTLSKWVIVKQGASGDAIVSHARYPDRIHAIQNTMQEKPTGKIGLGGYWWQPLKKYDLDALGITSVTINMWFTFFMRSAQDGKCIEHPYGGKTYYFDEEWVKRFDALLLDCAERNIVTAFIVQVQQAAHCADKVIGNILQHPDYEGGRYPMPNMTTPESVNTYAAAIDFLASRYCRPDKLYGRVHHWIMHNEVDAGIEWTNMGRGKPMLLFMDAYVKSMRLCYNIARQYDRHTEVFGSFTHSWSRSVGIEDAYSSLEMLHALNDYCRAEGDFQWALAFHPYPQDLNEPKTWNDPDATYSARSPLITFKNLEVLDFWAKQKENKYKGIHKRTVWLSENGTNSRTYDEKDLCEQAAGFAWAWKKIKQLDGIDGIQWHNWADAEDEGGLRIGLRKFGSHGNEPKEVWYVYQAAGTADEDRVFQKYLSVIGIPDWNILQPVEAVKYSPLPE